MLFNKRSARGFDWVLLLTVAILTLIGLAGIYSIDLSRGAGTGYLEKQVLALAIGTALMLGANFTRYTFFRSSAKWWYLLALALLIAVFIFGRSIRGTRGWFVMGGFSFQP